MSDEHDEEDVPEDVDKLPKFYPYHVCERNVYFRRQEGGSNGGTDLIGDRGESDQHSPPNLKKATSLNVFSEKVEGGVWHHFYFRY